MSLALSTASGEIQKRAELLSKAATFKPPLKVLLLADQVEDSSYIRQFRDCAAKVSTKFNLSISFDKFDYLEQLKLTTRQYDFIFISQDKSAALFLNKGTTVPAAAGSVYFDKYCILPPLQYFHTVPYANWLFTCFLRKGLAPESFLPFPKFTWELVSTEEQHLAAINFLLNCVLHGDDIETTPTKVDPATNEATAPGISCIAFSGYHKSGAIKTFVYDCRNPFFFANIRQILRLDIPKTFQNGLYDIANLMRWNCTPTYWVHDTAYFHHSLYSETPKDLGFLAAINLLDFQYWKKEGKYATNLEEYHRYNAKDAYATLCIAITQLLTAPRYANDNFAQNFPNFFPSLFCGMHGVKANKATLKELREQAQLELDRDNASLRKMVRAPDFNASSPQQVEKLLNLFGINGMGTDEKALEKISRLHPLLEIFCGKILDIRANVKAIGTYYTPIFLAGRVLYSLNPAGTVSNRLASRESWFWTGTNIQNQPPYAKIYFEADDEFELVEIDNSQSETRCTAYISEEPNLLAVISDTTKDFHTYNIQMFFGDSYDEVLKQVKECKKKKIPHVKRELAKRINHGKSYNMGPDVFLMDAGERIIQQARDNLHLDPTWSSRDVAAYLLGLFDKAYPGLKNDWYPKVINEIAFTNKLVGATGWTRYFFRQPSSSKRALNLSIAHGPQSLSVNILNIGFRRCFWEIQLVEPQNFRMLAQIHDSIFFQVRKTEKTRLIKKVEECCKNPITVNGRELLIPTETKELGQTWSSNTASGRYKFWKVQK